jgi:hypothetical protein
LRPARNGNAATVALFAAAHVPGRMAEVYGGRINGAIEIVAMDSATGRVYFRSGERPGAVPFSAVMDRRTTRDPHSAPTESADTWLNCDLRAYLELPSQAATYVVLLWLDELTSRVQVIDVPGAAASDAVRAVPASRVDVQWLDRTAKQPSGGGIALRTLSDRGTKIEAELDTSALRRSSALALLAIDYRTRACRSATLASPSSGKAGFVFDPAVLWRVANGKRGDAVLLAAIAGTSVSNILRLQGMVLRDER